MTGLNHVLTGIAIAVTVKQPILAPTLSLASHFLLDSVPHFGKHPDIVPYNRKFKIYLALEAIAMTVALVTALLIIDGPWFLIALCAGLAFLPDFFWILEPRLKHKNRFTEKFYHFHDRIQTGERPDGWLIELGYLGILLLILAQYI